METNKKIEEIKENLAKRKNGGHRSRDGRWMHELLSELSKTQELLEGKEAEYQTAVDKNAVNARERQRLQEEVKEAYTYRDRALNSSAKYEEMYEEEHGHVLSLQAENEKLREERYTVQELAKSSYKTLCDQESIVIILQEERKKLIDTLKDIYLKSTDAYAINHSKERLSQLGEQ